MGDLIMNHLRFHTTLYVVRTVPAIREGCGTNMVIESVVELLACIIMCGLGITLRREQSLKLLTVYIY